MTRPDVRRLNAATLTEPAFVQAATRLLAELVAGGAALGWVDPPTQGEVEGLLSDLARDSERDSDSDEVCAVAAWTDSGLAGLGYWRRYTRPTHRPHVDIERVAVAPGAQGRGLGRALTERLVEEARARAVEVVTLDFRGDNVVAERLYRSLGFVEYGRLTRFVAVGERRYDKVFHALDLREPSTPAG